MWDCVAEPALLSTTVVPPQHVAVALISHVGALFTFVTTVFMGDCVIDATRCILCPDVGNRDRWCYGLSCYRRQWPWCRSHDCGWETVVMVIDHCYLAAALHPFAIHPVWRVYIYVCVCVYICAYVLCNRYIYVQCLYVYMCMYVIIYIWVKEHYNKQQHIKIHKCMS